MKSVTKFVVVFLVLCLLAFFLYKNSGIESHRSIIQGIDNLKDTEQRLEARRQFLSGEGDGDAYNGVVSFVNTFRSGGVLVYSNLGFRYYKANSDTSFTYLSICKNNPIESIRFGLNPKIDRTVYTDIVGWRSGVRVGDYVEVVISKEDKGKGIARLRSVVASDFVPFLNQELNSLCQGK